MNLIFFFSYKSVILLDYFTWGAPNPADPCLSKFLSEFMERRGLIYRSTAMIDILVFQLILLWFNIATTIYHRNTHIHKYRWNNYLSKISLELSLIGALHLSAPLYTQVYMNFSVALIFVAFPMGCHPAILLLNLAEEKENAWGVGSPALFICHQVNLSVEVSGNLSCTSNLNWVVSVPFLPGGLAFPSSVLAFTRVNSRETVMGV